jgi:hypothetical protein
MQSSAVRPRRRFGRWLLILIVLLIAGTLLWTWVTLAWAYADGERAGVLQKFVRRGWLCKTQEGEIALYYGGSPYMGTGSNRQIWDFSVRDRSIADDLAKAVGHRVQLHYTEHPGIPTNCFGDTRYFVDRVTITDNETQGLPGPPSIAPPPSGTPAPSGAPAPQAAPKIPGAPPAAGSTPPT